MKKMKLDNGIRMMEWWGRGGGRGQYIPEDTFGKFHWENDVWA